MPSVFVVKKGSKAASGSSIPIPVVSYLQRDGATVGPQRADRELLRAAADGLERLERVERQVEHELLQLNPIGVQRWQLGIEQRLQRHVFA